MSHLRLCAALLLFLVSCLKPGGGGSDHIPPALIHFGVETGLKLELSAVYEDGPMDRRMTRITCHYRLAGSPTFTALPMSSTSVDTRHLVASATLPSFPKESKGPLEYYFDFYFDGHYNQRESPTKPIVVPLR